MGFWRNLFAPVELTDAHDEYDATFTTSPGGVDLEPEVARAFGIELITPGASGARVDRRTAMTVPSVKRCRDLVAGVLGSMPLDATGPDRAPARFAVVTQPEPTRVASVTMTWLYEDLLFEGIAWWRIVGRTWNGFPSAVKRLPPREVTVREADGSVWHGGKRIPDSDLIRFDSPNDALLVAGGRAIRTLMRLDQAAANAAEGVPPVDYFTPADDTDPADETEIKAILNAWKKARAEGRTAYVPAALKYNLNGFNPEQLQLAEQRRHAAIEIANLAGVDPEELGISTTSRTYHNGQDRRSDFLDFTLGPYRQAVELRLSADDVTPHGYQVRHNVSAFLRTDDLTRMRVYEIGRRVGAYTDDEIRDYEDRPPLTAAQRAALPPATAAPTTQESTP